MELNNQNYHSTEANTIYMGSTQFKNFLKCPSCAIAKIRGELKEEKTTALLVGSFVDDVISGGVDEFRKNNPEIFKKDGTLKSEFIQAQDIIDFIQKDQKFMKYLEGEHQVIMTGEIAGVPFKIKMDSYFPDKIIVDLKVMKDLQPVWDDDSHRYMNLVEYYGYDISGAIYQEIVRQNTGKKLPFVLAIATKEKVPEKALLEIDQERLDECLDLVRELAPKYAKMKKGEIPVESCGKCNWCKSNKMVTGIFSYHILDTK